MSMTVADLIAQTLTNAGVKRIWGVTGDSLNGLNDSLRRLDTIEWMHVRHEETAAFAAGAEAAITGELAVCAGSCGPGNLHLINGLFDCHRNRTPVLAIAAHIPSSEIGLGYFQETHPQELFRECSDFCELVTNPAQITGVLARALNTAVGKGGVAVIVIPGDVALAKAPDGASTEWNAPGRPRISPAEVDLDHAAELLNGANKVTILAGSGCAGAHDAVVALAEALQAPVVHALRGKEHVEWDNPYSVGMTGLIGFSSGYHAMLACEALGKRATLAQGIVGDVNETVSALLPRLKHERSSRFLESAQKHYVGARKGLADLARPSPPGKPIHPQYVAEVVSRLAEDDAIFTADVGTPTVWAARYLEMNGRRRLIGSFNHGSMANAMLQAMGAQATAPDRQVVSLSGDGGFTMMMGDFISLTQLKLPVKVIVFNNGSLGFVAMEMKAAGFLDTGTDLKNPNFAAMAAAMGVTAFRVEDSGDLEEAVAAALAHPGPALVDVITAQQELVIPPKIKLEQAKGFGLYMLKAVMNGRGDEVLALAKTNL